MKRLVSFVLTLTAALANAEPSRLGLSLAWSSEHAAVTRADRGAFETLPLATQMELRVQSSDHRRSTGT